MSVLNAEKLESSTRTSLIRKAFQLEYLTVTWMSIEAAIAIVSGLAAGSLTLTTFGIDSLIELASAGALLWRLNVELRRDARFAEEAERTTSRLAGALLITLAVYVVVSAGWKFWTRQGAEFSLPGLIVTVLAVPIMYCLSRSKLRIAERIGSTALRADAIQSLTCGWLAFVAIGALVAQLLIGAWWLDAAASLVVVWYLIREGREAWEGKECCSKGCS